MGERAAGVEGRDKREFLSLHLFVNLFSVVIITTTIARYFAVASFKLLYIHNTLHKSSLRNKCVRRSRQTDPRPRDWPVERTGQRLY